MMNVMAGCDILKEITHEYYLSEHGAEFHC